MEAIQQPLSNMQLELLKVFSHELNENELFELKKVLVQFFANRAIQAANQVWDEKGWTDADVDKNLGPEMKSTGEAIYFIKDLSDPYFRELDRRRYMYLTR